MPPDCFERKPSGVHGLGVFTKVHIPEGTAVFEFGGPSVPWSRVPPDARYLQVGPDEFVVEDRGADYIENYVNHSCQPNLGFVGGSLRMRAIRDIRPGEELFWDYTTSMHEPGSASECRCGAANCRRVIRSYREESPAVRQQLAPITLAYLRETDTATGT